jgi:hypothetical protein
MIKLIEFSGDDYLALEKLIPNVNSLGRMELGIEIAKLLRTHALPKDDDLAIK